jgi:hypothetical protein
VGINGFGGAKIASTVRFTACRTLLLSKTGVRKPYEELLSAKTDILKPYKRDLSAKTTPRKPCEPHFPSKAAFHKA